MRILYHLSGGISAQTFKMVYCSLSFTELKELGFPRWALDDG